MARESVPQPLTKSFLADMLNTPILPPQTYGNGTAYGNGRAFVPFSPPKPSPRTEEEMRDSLARIEMLLEDILEALGGFKK